MLIRTSASCPHRRCFAARVGTSVAGAGDDWCGGAISGGHRLRTRAVPGERVRELSPTRRCRRLGAVLRWASRCPPVLAAYPADPAYLRVWLHHLQALKPATTMPNLGPRCRDHRPARFHQERPVRISLKLPPSRISPSGHSFSPRRGRCALRVWLITPPPVMSRIMVAARPAGRALLFAYRQ